MNFDPKDKEVIRGALELIKIHSADKPSRETVKKWEKELGMKDGVVILAYEDFIESNKDDMKIAKRVLETILNSKAKYFSSLIKMVMLITMLWITDIEAAEKFINAGLSTFKKNQKLLKLQRGLEQVIKELEDEPNGK